jgi:hypothetical protein
MRITWKDGVTTLSTAGAIVLERAYFHDWDLPLVSNMKWVIAGLVLLTAVGFVFSYVLDAVRGAGWSLVAGILAASTIVLAGLGLYYTNSDYVVLLMLNAILFWFASLVRHVTVHVPMTQSHA